MAHAISATANRCNRHISISGFTLIELMVAMVILFISMTAILHFVVLYQRINIENGMRNEAMRVAEAKLEELRNVQFGTWPAGPETVTRRIRNITVNYSVAWGRENVSASSVAFRVNVTWVYRGVSHQHNASTIITTDV